jgi:hypothetical protein
LASDRFLGEWSSREIEAHIDGLARADGLDPVGGESVQRRGQQAGLFFGEDIGERAVVPARPAPSVRDLVASE